MSLTLTRWLSVAAVISMLPVAAVVLDRTERCGWDDSEWPTYLLMLTAGAVFAAATYAFSPRRWSVAARLIPSFAVGGAAVFGVVVLSVWTWVARCSN